MKIAPQIAVDFGSTKLRVANTADNIFSCAACVVRNVSSGNVLAVGDEALSYVLKPGEERVFPILSGQLVDYRGAVTLLSHAFSVVLPWWHVFKPQVIVAVSCGLSPAVTQTLGEAVREVGGGRVYTVSVPVLAALGAGIDPSALSGSLVLDVGGGTTEAGVITRGSAVETATTTIGGGDLVAALAAYIGKKYNVHCPPEVAEKVLKRIGAAVTRESTDTYTCYLDEIGTGDTKEIVLSTSETTEAIVAPLEKIVSVLRSIIKKTPTTLLSDIAENGVFITGGVADLDYFDTYIKRQLSIPVQITKQPQQSVIRGAVRATDFISTYQHSVPQKKET